ncbi:Tyrosine--tRNA ligase [Planctomycetes bacterium Pan216]|uniref:Tyrosine--tRNA ligase n=1 Tax=Kolteria novifilia TaxID=2527975 RepID=A0A518B9C9_9BACT|nr:Tyrosine--tRNA ligase [Planctomycetes bacterium Pan216]
MTEAAFWSDLTDRGMVQQTTNETMGDWIASQLGSNDELTCYCGFDPTADSLHIGSLLPVVGLRRLKNAGLKPIALVGGATGMIGDPSGKTTERTLLDADALDANVKGIGGQLETLLEGTAGQDFLMVNNYDWFGDIRFVDFLRDVGKHFSVNMMVAKESVRARLEDRDHGISYTEFSYMLLQAYDFLHLFETHGCRLQVGGSDQWGNITAGIDLIHRKHHGEEIEGITFPLITTSSGKKFGKSEKGNIWLDRKRTHPYFMYKYFFDTDDADVVRFLKCFTFVPLEEIGGLATSMETEPHLRATQKALARQVTGMVHGAETAEACAGLEPAMHHDDVEAFEKHAETLGLLDPSSIGSEESSTDLPVVHRPLSELQGEGLLAADLAIACGLFKSKGEVRREVGSNSGFRIDGKPVESFDYRITSQLLGSRRVLQIRKGKKNKRMVCFHG